MRKIKHELTQGEWIIIQAVWDREPCAAPTVQETLEKRTKWTYSTVKTMMDRMVKKKLLKTKKIRNLILYRSAITRSEAQSGEVLRAVKRAFNGAMTPMMQFMIENEEMSEEDLKRMEGLIKRKRKGQDSRR